MRSRRIGEATVNIFRRLFMRSLRIGSGSATVFRTIPGEPVDLVPPAPEVIVTNGGIAFKFSVLSYESGPQLREPVSLSVFLLHGDAVVGGGATLEDIAVQSEAELSANWSEKTEQPNGFDLYLAKDITSLFAEGHTTRVLQWFAFANYSE